MPGTSAHRRRRALVSVAVGVVVVVALVVLLQWWSGADRFGTVTVGNGPWAYVFAALFVFLDGVCAVFPGETTLNAASTLAAQGVLSLTLVMLAGAVGAVGGDSALYWIARRYRERVRPRLDRARQNDKVASALAFIGSSAPLLLVVGRYVPGVRLVVNATFGISAHPYRHFLLWSAVGGTLWSVYTCGLAYLVGTALAGFPLASVVISGSITTLAVAAVFLVAARRRRRARRSTPA